LRGRDITGLLEDGGGECVSDEALMAIFARGCGEGAGPAERQEGAVAFEELFGRYKQPLYGFFRRRTREPARADELTQECFLAVLRSGAKYRPTATFRTFLYAIGLNLMRAERRKTMFRAMFMRDSDGEHEAGAGALAGSDPRTELGLMVRDALGRLDRADREMLMLRQFEELSYDEIAEVLHVPVGTVRSRLFRAKAALREVWHAAPAKAMNVTEMKQEGRA
jgi:RNA polymerase sigma-70 factor (ECF subfamily)